MKAQVPLKYWYLNTWHLITENVVWFSSLRIWQFSHSSMSRSGENWVDSTHKFRICCVECTSRHGGRGFLFFYFPPDSTWNPSCWRGNNDRPGSAQVEENKARRGKQSSNNKRERKTGRRKLQAHRKDDPLEQNHLLLALTSSSAKLQVGGFPCKMVPS